MNVMNVVYFGDIKTPLLSTSFGIILVNFRTFAIGGKFMQSIPSESLAIDRKARVNLPFYDLDLRPAHIRTLDFDENIANTVLNRPARRK